MIKVGCCGFPISQTKYYEIFSLVELNSTFYKYPTPLTAQKWRSKAPENFEFTVKAHQDISHKYRLRIEQSKDPFERIKQICRILNAKIILIQTPASFSIKELEKAGEFFRKINREDFILVWETRGTSWESEESYKRLKDVLGELNVTHVTDPFKLMPAFISDLAYFRLHGLGERMYYYQYTNDELRRLYEIAREFEGLEMGVYVLFNNLSMFEDAKRFAFFLENKCFPPLTGTFGLDSIKSMLSKARYPANRNLLIDKIGWRLIELKEGKQVRLSTLLDAIPAKTYRSLDEIMEEIKARTVL
ncbi:DUF72 domain-containing protein [Candidatus Bathyarchaeota archaeon]|nr:DUF72 domain-containing protein [Candidatus Bathyarchaeota archaeon]